VDPDKAMEAVVDVVKGEGKAKGRPWPLYLALGDDADEGIRQKSTTLLRHVDEWRDVIKSVILTLDLLYVDLGHPTRRCSIISTLSMKPTFGFADRNQKTVFLPPYSVVDRMTSWDEIPSCRILTRNMQSLVYVSSVCPQPANIEADSSTRRHVVTPPLKPMERTLACPKGT